MKIVSFINKYCPNIFKQTQATVSKPLFCQEYVRNLHLPQLKTRTSVSMHESLNSINHFFITGANPQYINMPSSLLNNVTPRNLIAAASKEFRTLKPTEKAYTVYRCIGKKPEFFQEYQLYQKTLNTKIGDKICMREYAYATSDINYAKRYLPNNEGIIYEMEIPANSERISRIGNIGGNDEFVFDRSSFWECTGIKIIKDQNNDYKIIKLRKINKFLDSII